MGRIRARQSLRGKYRRRSIHLETKKWQYPMNYSPIFASELQLQEAGKECKLFSNIQKPIQQSVFFK